MSKPILWCDLETFSPTPIKYGSHKYAEKAELLLFPFAFGDGEVQLWDAIEDKEFPPQLISALLDPEQETGWFNGSNFDSVILQHTHGIDLPPNRILDVMVQAMSHAMPGKLSTLCDVLGFGEDLAKSKEGTALIRLFCIPQKFTHRLLREAYNSKAEYLAAVEDAKSKWNGRATRESHPIEWQKFKDYAKQDIVSMRAAYKMLPRWNYPAKKERDIFNLDQISNRRGVAIDVAFAQAAVRAVERSKVSLAAKCKEETDGAVESATQVKLLREFIFEEYGYHLADVRKSTLEKLLENYELPIGLRELLEIRLSASSTSVGKYPTLVAATSSDGRIRGTVQFCGAVRSKRECLAENTQVVVKTPNGEIFNRNIQDVLLSDMLWDGDEWVSHEGVVYSGDKEVIYHNSTLATSEHKVYISSSECVTLGEAKRRGLELWSGNDKNIFNISANIT